MRFNCSFLLLISAAVLIISCNKEDVSSTTPPTDSTITGTNNLFVRLQEGPGNDTVYKFTYDSNKRMETISDSVWGTKMTATYNAAGNISTIVLAYATDNIRTYTYTYNSSNQLTKIDYLDSGITPTTFEITYANGMPSKMTQNYTYNGVTKTYRTSVYTVKDSNITNVKEYDADNKLSFEISYTFTDKENILKPLGLFAYNIGSMGLSGAGSLEAFFNKNLIASSTFYDVVVTNYAYTYNDNKQLTKFVASTTEALYAGIHTRVFGY